MPRAAPSVDRIFNREFAVRPCPNADVVAELPVVEVVAAAVPRPGKGRDLVVFKAGLTGEILDGATYVP